MTSFRFNFSGETVSNVNASTADSSKVIQWFDSCEVVPEHQIKNFDEKVTRAKMFACGDVEIGHVVASEALARIEESGLENAVKLADKEHSDLVAGTYEGGFKVWECTYDLVEFLENETEVNFDSKNVIDLGCGTGILGIYAFLKGSLVTFQDYNKEVLEYVTIPNVLLNIEEESNRAIEIKKCKFYSGDWNSFNKKLPDDIAYDYILASETIYNPCNYDKLISLFIQRLKKDGAVYVAAKTYYFGIGGGIREFELAIESNGKLKSCVCWKSTGGIQREIIKITHNKP
ncbi:unnamed protein product [Arctia plantaginis]|uniref:protein-histidine N-methyltransferase n=1 Tax=Arctia plantaginis TaxID=874455 RepID=A0A8S0ZQV9_ARCPL|nr:unnamed protein product [Arctia plantaginis]